RLDLALEGDDAEALGVLTEEARARTDQPALGALGEVWLARADPARAMQALREAGAHAAELLGPRAHGPRQELSDARARDGAMAVMPTGTTGRRWRCSCGRAWRTRSATCASRRRRGCRAARASAPPPGRAGCGGARRSCSRRAWATTPRPRRSSGACTRRARP